MNDFWSIADATLNRVTSRYMGSLSDFRQRFESRHSPCMMDVKMT